MANADTPGSGRGNSGPPQQHPARDFDREPEPSPGPPSESEQAIEEFARRNAERARQRLLAERAARQARARAPGAGAPAPVAAPGGPAAVPPLQPSPGKERWPVKTVTDTDQGLVSTSQLATPKTASVDDMWLLERPADMPLTRAAHAYQSHRAQGPETTIWQVTGFIIAHKWEQDGDYHIVLKDDETGYTMIVESPQADTDDDLNRFVGNSPFKAQIQAARQKLTERLHPSPEFVSVNIPATITGIGFFDILHGQNGVATTNAIELHPILDVQFTG